MVAMTHRREFNPAFVVTLRKLFTAITMSNLQAFLLGVMAAWTPSLILLAWMLPPITKSTPESDHSH